MLIYRLLQTTSSITKLIDNLSGKYFGAAILLHFSTSIDKAAEARKQTKILIFSIGLSQSVSGPACVSGSPQVFMLRTL